MQKNDETEIQTERHDLYVCVVAVEEKKYLGRQTHSQTERERERQTLHHIHSVANNLKLQKTRLRRSIWVSGILGAERC